MPRREPPETLTVENLQQGHQAYREHEGRDAMYRVAMFLVATAGNDPSKKTDGLGVILLTWNARVYLGGALNFESLQQCLERNRSKLEAYNSREITSLTNSDEYEIKEIFGDFLKATASHLRRSGETKFSPVSTAKALHILAPRFFPIWDDEIAKGYRCYWSGSWQADDKYWQFMLRIKRIAEGFSARRDEINMISSNSILKLIDEYNYCTMSNNWL